MLEIIQVSFDGLLIGSSYSLLALGFSLVFGVLRRINLAYGSTLLIGGATATWITTHFQSSYFWIFPIMILVSCAANVYVEKLCFNPHKGQQGVVVSMVASFAIWMQLDEISSHLLPFRTHAFPELPVSNIQLDSFFVRADQLIQFVVAIISMAILFFIVYRTKFGIILRAVANNPETARTMGVNVSTVNLFTFALSGVFGGIAAFMILSSESQITPLFGFWCTIKGLVAMMIGGVGSLIGAVLGGLFLGVLEAHLTTQFGVVYRDIGTFAILLVILVLRPGGLIGTAVFRDDKGVNERI